MNYPPLLVLNVLCAMSFFSNAMESNIYRTDSALTHRIQLETSAQVNVCNNNGKDPLCLAVTLYQVEIVKKLIANGSQQKDNALLEAAYMDNISTYHKDAVYLHNPTKRNKSNQARLEIVHYLISMNANVNIQSISGHTPLALACAKNNTDVAMSLIQAGADVNIKNNKRESALVDAVKHANVELIEALVNAKADVNVSNQKGEPLLRLVLHWNNKPNQYKIVKMLIEHGSQQQDEALWPAIFYGYVDIVCFLIEAGAQINALDKNRKTLLLKAVHSNCTAIAKNLICAGADVNIADEYGNTALSGVLKRDNMELLQALVEANVDIPNKYRTSVLDRAICSQYTNYGAGASLYLKHPIMPIKIINPTPTSCMRKSIQLLLMGYRNGDALSVLPREILKIIIACAYPEYVLDQQMITHLHPKVLVDTVSLEMLSNLIKDKRLDQKAIFNAWKEKLADIMKKLKEGGHDPVRHWQFEEDFLRIIESYLGPSK